MEGKLGKVSRWISAGFDRFKKAEPGESHFSQRPEVRLLAQMGVPVEEQILFRKNVEAFLQEERIKEDPKNI